MRLKVFGTTLVALALAVSLAGQDVAREQKLQQAIDLLETKGDATRAMPLLEEVAKSADQGLAARALLYLGQAQERQGSDAARATYGRIIREFANHSAVVERAKARLDALGTGGRRSSSVVSRALWSTGAPEVAAIAPDGRRLAYVNDEGVLMIRDLSTGVDRVLSKTDLWAETMSFSPDSNTLAYTWLDTRDESRWQWRLRLMSLSGPPAAPRTIYSHQPGSWFSIANWSDDASRAAVQMRDQAGAFQLGLISLGTGELKVLKTLGPRVAGGVSLSSDGAFVAYDAPARPDVAQRDAFVLPTSGGPEVRVVDGPEGDGVVGWSPDGRQLIYVSEGRGDSTLRAQPLAAGRVSGPSVVLHKEIRGYPVGITAAGTLVMSIVTNEQKIHVATLDMTTGQQTAPVVTPISGAWPRNRHPKWSRDGRAMAYMSSGTSMGVSERILSIQPEDGGPVRILPLPLQQFWTYDWSPDAKNFVARAADYQNRIGLYRIDAQTGAVTPLILNDETIQISAPHWGDQNDKFYYTKVRRNQGESLMERDLTNGSERELLRTESVQWPDGGPLQGRDWAVSPDGKFVAGYKVRPESVVWVAAIADKTVREVFKTAEPNALATNSLTWTPDSRAVVVNRWVKQENRRELWVAPLDGAPRKLNINDVRVTGEAIAIHPDGRRVAFVAGPPPTIEIRAIENVIPVGRTAKKRF